MAGAVCGVASMLGLSVYEHIRVDRLLTNVLHFIDQIKSDKRTGVPSIVRILCCALDCAFQRGAVGQAACAGGVKADAAAVARMRPYAMAALATDECAEHAARRRAHRESAPVNHERGPCFL